MKIAIIGLGLIGASIAKKLQGRYDIIGIDTDDSVMEMAATSRLVRRGKLAEAEIVILCTYLGPALEFVRKNKRVLAGKLITDAIGVKKQIVDLCEELELAFVGMHPMAGREVSGYDAAISTLFDGANFIITPSSTSTNAQLGVIKTLAGELGAGQVTITTAANHDKMVGYTSQLPHVISMAMCAMPLYDQYHGYNGGSFRDITRIGCNINRVMWDELFDKNKHYLLEHISEFQARLEDVKRGIMGSITIAPKKLKGEVVIPPSKSLANRAIIGAGLAKGVSRIRNVAFSADILAAIEAMRTLGAEIEIEKNELVIDGTNTDVNSTAVIDCNESGTLLRLLQQVATKAEFTGSERLMQRSDPKSSQHISGRLLGAVFAGEDVEILAPDGGFQSWGYVDLTIDMMGKMGIEVENHDYERFVVRAGQAYQPIDYTIEADCSQSAFWLVAKELGNDVVITNFPESSKQGDRAIKDILADGPWAIDVGQIPDLVPILAVWAAFRDGDTVIYNAERLRSKESDRLAATTAELRKLGAHISEYPDGLSIHGLGENATLRGGVVDSWNDHRIAMALAIAATRADGEVTILGHDSVKKSYPDFWEVYGGLQRGL